MAMGGGVHKSANEIKKEIEALEAILQVLKGSDKESVEREIKQLKLALEGMGNDAQNQKFYIDFLNKKKGFKKDRIYFNSREEAKDWAYKNLERFDPDMIKTKMAMGGGVHKSANEIKKEIEALEAILEVLKGSDKESVEREIKQLKLALEGMGNDAQNGDNIKSWYISKYPSDDLGEELNPNAEFSELAENLANIYTYLGVADSVVRERVFERYSEIFNKPYEYIYDKWVKAEGEADGDFDLRVKFFIENLPKGLGEKDLLKFELYEPSLVNFKVGDKEISGFLFKMISKSEYPVNRATPKLKRSGIVVERVGEKGNRIIAVPLNVFNKLTEKR
jgi:acetolactate synthase small subunit/biotin operon repressor